MVEGMLTLEALGMIVSQTTTDHYWRVLMVGEEDADCSRCKHHTFVDAVASFFLNP
jgi:hypothetical protein